MGTESIRVSGLVPASPKQIFEAWMDSRGHTAFTGSKANVDPKIGGKHTAWNGYIQGTTLELEPSRRIVQSWRSSDFPPDARDSRLEILLAKRKDGTTEITFLHSGIPEGQARQYEEGWIDHYLTPMRRYFGAVSLARTSKTEGAVKAAASTARGAGDVKAPKPGRAPTANASNGKSTSRASSGARSPRTPSAGAPRPASPVSTKKAAQRRAAAKDSPSKTRKKTPEKRSKRR